MSMTKASSARAHIPRHKADDYTHELAAQRRDFIRQNTGAMLSLRRNRP
jgi:hypothetical protein